MIKQYDEIVDVKKRIFDSTLIVGSVLGVITFLLSLRNFNESDIKINYLLNLLVIVVYFGVYILRNTLNQKVKSIVVIVGLFILSFLDIYKLGTYSTAKILLVLIPFYSLIVFNYRRIIAVSVLALIIYLYFALQFTMGNWVPTINLNERTLNFSSWMVNLSLIVIVTYAVLTIVNLFNKTFYKLIKNLEEQNTELQAHRENLQGLVAERSRELESANEELSTINEELYQSNNIIETKNIELNSTIKNLKETQTKLVQSEKMASIGTLAAGVAHEINNPLNFIMGGYAGLVDYFISSGNLDNKEIAYFLNSIKTGVDRASEIVKALNQFSRDNDSYDEICEIHSIIDNCLIILTNQYKGRIEIIKEYNNESIRIPGNISKLHQVFINILSNSTNAIETKGKIWISTSQNDNQVVIQISDSGCGISKDNLARVTDPFFTTKDPGEGTGLGLSIACSIIEKHNGELNIESEVEKGTTVKIKLPHKN